MYAYLAAHCMIFNMQYLGRIPWLAADGVAA